MTSGIQPATGDQVNNSGQQESQGWSVEQIEDGIDDVIAESGEAVNLSDEDKTKIATAIEAASADANISEEMLIAMGFVESRYQIGVAGSDNLGSIGIFQVIPETAEQMGVPADDRSDPNADAIAGARYLAMGLNMYDGDLTKTLDGYNGGMDDTPEQNPAAQVDYDQEVIGLMDSIDVSGGGNQAETLAKGGETQQPTETPQNKQEIDTMVDDLAETAGVDSELVKAIIEVQSEYDANAENGGAVGLMQIMPDTAGKTAKELKDPKTNIQAGIDYLKQIQVEGDDEETLRKYFDGAESTGEPSQAAQTFIDEVMAIYGTGVQQPKE